MFCAISGKPTRVPVLSPSSKCVFEKQLIEEYVQQEGKDPVNDAALTVDQLIPIAQTPEQTSLANNLNSSTLNSNYSIPNLLSSLQNEWDAVMLENFKLRKQLNQCTKQLSTALYQRDAAKIVATKAMAANEGLKRELAQLVSELGSTAAAEVEEPDMGLLERLRHESEAYLAKTRKIGSDFNLSVIAPFRLETQYTVNDSLNLHRAISLRLESQQKLAFQLSIASEVCSLIGPSNYRTIEVPLKDEVRYIKCTASGEQLLFAPAHGSCCIHDLVKNVTYDTEVESRGVIYMSSHEEILSDHLLWASNTGRIGLTTLNGEKTFVIIEGSSDEEFFTATYHKDGILFALASKSAIKIFDLSRPSELPTVFQVGEQINAEGEIKRVQFSSNGYWMVVQCGDVVISFDLRKEPGTLAVNAFPLGTELWDMDVSGRNLVLLTASDDDHYKLDFYDFQKSKKIWKSVNTTFDVKIEQDSKIKDFLMLFTKEGPVAVIQTSNEVLLYTTQ